MKGRPFRKSKGLYAPLPHDDPRNPEHPGQRESVLALVRAIAEQAADEAFDLALAKQQVKDDKK